MIDVLITSLAGSLVCLAIAFWVIYKQGETIKRQARLIVNLDAMCDALSPMPKLSVIPRKNLMFGEPDEIAKRIAEEW